MYTSRKNKGMKSLLVGGVSFSLENKYSPQYSGYFVICTFALFPSSGSE